ncbi:hypothetical protein N9B73_12680, partial [Verrucomicrobiales bacterium]|nr:hypothetical protein [Verrucomicrobiales bacterium]
MPDSWIDKEEFDELLGAFSPKKRKSQHHGADRSLKRARAALDQVAESSKGEEVPPDCIDQDESQSDQPDGDQSDSEVGDSVQDVLEVGSNKGGAPEDALLKIEPRDDSVGEVEPKGQK